MTEKNIKQEEQNQEERKTYKAVQGKFNYGGSNKEYGLFFLLINEGPTPVIEKLDLAIANQKNLNDIDLKISSKMFVEVVKEAKQNAAHKSQKLGMELKNNLKVDELEEIQRAIDSGELEKLARVFKEKLEDYFQEQTRVKTEYITLVEDEVKDIYPSLFESEDSLTETEDESTQNEDEETKKEKPKITLKSSPVISPASGIMAENLNIGDTVSVKITEGSETAKRYKSKLHGDKGFVEGEITELLFNKESNRYSVLINFQDNIYGELIVGPQVRIAGSSNSDKADNLAESKENKTENDSQYNKNLILLFALIGILVILIIILFGFYLT